MRRVTAEVAVHQPLDVPRPECVPAVLWRACHTTSQSRSWTSSAHSRWKPSVGVVGRASPWLTDPDLDPRFLADAQSAGLVNLKGHRSVEGMRASIYNAMSDGGWTSSPASCGTFSRAPDEHPTSYEDSA